MALDITVQISTAAVGGKVGFGNPLVLMTKGTAEMPYTECSSLAEVKALFDVWGKDAQGKDAITTDGSTTDAYKIAQLIWMQENAPTKIAFYTSTNDADTAIAEVQDKNWRQLIVVFGDGDTDKPIDVAKYIEATEDKMYFTTATTTAELAEVKGYDRTVALYYDVKVKGTDGKETEEFAQPYAVVAIVGATAGRTVGSFTYKNRIIKGLEPLELTDNEISEIHNAGGMTILRKAGDVVTSEGKNTKGEYIDIVDSKDWIVQQIEYQAQKLLNNTDKLSYTDEGIAALESVVVNVLKEAYNNEMIATDEDGTTPLYAVDFKSRSEMSAEDRKNRTYNGGNFEFTLAGAIHDAKIVGQLVI